MYEFFIQGTSELLEVKVLDFQIENGTFLELLKLTLNPIKGLVITIPHLKAIISSLEP